MQFVGNETKVVWPKEVATAEPVLRPAKGARLRHPVVRYANTAAARTRRVMVTDTLRSVLSAPLSTPSR